MLLPMETKRQTSELSISHKIMNVWTKEKSLRNHAGHLDDFAATFQSNAEK